MELGAGELEHRDRAEQQTGDQGQHKGEDQHRNVDRDVRDARQVSRGERDEQPQCAKRQREADDAAEAANVTLSSSSSRAIRFAPAPRAARMASSCCRDSALTRSRFATFAQAMRSTIPIVPINTHNTFCTSPTRSSLSEQMLGVRRASSNILMLPPGNGGKRVSEIGIMRATSALAWAIVVPDFNRAMPVKLNCPRNTLLRSKRYGSTRETLRSRNRNVSGSTPMISRGRPSTINMRPMAARSAPNFDRQYPALRTTVSVPPGAIVCPREQTSERRLHAEHRQDAVGDEERAHLLGLGQAGDTDRAEFTEPDILENLTILAVGEVEKRRGPGSGQVDARQGVIEHDQLVGAWIRQRLQQHALDYAEDRRIGADADGQRQHRDAGEERHLGEASQNLVESHSETYGRRLSRFQVEPGVSGLGTSACRAVALAKAEPASP